MKYIRWAMTVLYAFVILYISTRKIGGSPLFPYSDKIAHFVMYGGLGYLCAWSLRGSVTFAWKGVVMLSFALVTLYGAANEIVQIFVPTRSVEMMDAIANAAGAFVGSALAVLFASRHRTEVREAQ